MSGLTCRSVPAGSDYISMGGFFLLPASQVGDICQGLQEDTPEEDQKSSWKGDCCKEGKEMLKIKEE